MPYQKINFAEQFGTITDYWSAKAVGDINNSTLKLVKFKGEFLWHEHPDQDEIFIVVKGTISITFSGGNICPVTEGECIIIPAGTPHATYAEEEAHILLIEPLAEE